MSLSDKYSHSQAAVRSDAAIDQGLRAHMLGVYNYMTAALAVTGLTAYLVFSLAVTSDAGAAAASLPNGTLLTALGKTIYMSPLSYVLAFAPLAAVLLLYSRLERLSLNGLHWAFWGFSVLMGLSLSSIFLRYTGASITQVFFVTSAAFAGLSLWGYTTKRDISGWGSFLCMGVIGLIVAGIINLFLGSSALAFAISTIGVFVFSGLTAYETQAVKDRYLAFRGDSTATAKLGIFGALGLYLSFLNLFLSLLYLFGDSE